MGTYLVPSQTITLATNGSAEGYVELTIASNATAMIFPGCTVYLKSNTVDSKEYVVVDTKKTVGGVTKYRVFLRLVTSNLYPQYTTSDVSAYLTANSAKIYIPEQTATFPYSNEIGIWTAPVF
jgi:hypothetical protein